MVERVQKREGMGETAVDGLLAGLVAGAVMMLFLLGAGLLGGTAVATTLGYFDPARGENWLNGLLGHLAVSGVYGVVYGVVRGWLVGWKTAVGRHSWLLGVVYGVVLWAAAQGVVLRTVEAGVEQIAPLVFAAGHVVYGAMVGYWLQK